MLPEVLAERFDFVCFRPLTGKLVLILRIRESVSVFSGYEFPSPYGEVGFNLVNMSCETLEQVKFPSPYGEVGFNLRRLEFR